MTPPEQQNPKINVPEPPTGLGTGFFIGVLESFSTASSN